jgi:diguanylate cyclase (GGDEF)-like protein
VRAPYKRIRVIEESEPSQAKTHSPNHRVRRSLITDILSLQFLITVGIALLALVGLTWTSEAVIRDNLSYWAQQWAGELNELGAPFYLRQGDAAVLDVERFIQKYPEINSVTWYRPDGSVFSSINKDAQAKVSDVPRLSPAVVAELAAKAGKSPAYMLREDIELNRKFRLSGPIWVESFDRDGLFGFKPGDAKTTVRLLGFVAVDLDFLSYQSTFHRRLGWASVALISLLVTSWICGRFLLKRALRPLAELQGPLAEVAEGKTSVVFAPTKHRETQAVVTALRDTLAALEKREKYLWHLANHDPLTGLYSRHRIVAELEAEIEDVTSRNKRSALFFVDLDQFKYINDTCGHPAGDQLLKLAAHQLKASVRSVDMVARFGGDEFVVLLRNASKREARAIANRALEHMRSVSHVEQGNVFHMQCSIGVAVISSGRFGPHDLIAQADMACQAAKTRGRNRVEFYDIAAKQNERMRQDVHWIRSIRSAFENDAFVLHFQPLLHIPTDSITHYEALLRMKTDDGFLGPQAFLPSALRSGLMPDIDRWVVENGVKALAGSRGSGFRLSVNLSTFAFEDQNFASEVRSLLKEYGVSGDRIVFEITEQVAVRFAVQTNKQIAILRDLGCRIAVDDFGTGYNSFSYLKRLVVDYLKIDGSFIKGLTQDRIDQSMVRMVGEVARAADIETVAEYVQSAATLMLLRKYGIDYAQGFYIGRAVENLPDTDADSKPVRSDVLLPPAAVVRGKFDSAV